MKSLVIIVLVLLGCVAFNEGKTRFSSVNQNSLRIF